MLVSHGKVAITKGKIKFKRLGAAIVAAFALAGAGSSEANPYDLVILQFDAGGFGISSQTVTLSGVNCIVYYDLASNRPACAALGTGLSLSSGAISASAPTYSQLISGLGYTPYDAANPSAYINLATARGGISFTTTGTGAASYNSATGALNVPTPSAQTTFNYSLPSAKSIAVSTDYQAADPSKAAVVTPSFACTNATTVLAASACTLQVRMGSSTLTCSTGTVLYTISQTVSLGVLLTQAQTVPAPIHLPIGAHFIVCPSAGTFTITAVEQTAN